MAGYPGLGSHVEAFSTEKVRESLAGATSSDIDVRVYGEELPVLESTATQAGDEDRQDRRRHARPRRAADLGTDDQGPGQPRQGGQVRPQARRRAARSGDAALGHPGRQPVREAARVRRRRLGHAADEEGPHRCPQSPDRDALRRERPPQSGRGRGHRAVASGDRAPGRVTPDRHLGLGRRPRPRRGHARHQPRPAVDARCRSSTTPRCSARTHSRSGG